MIMPVTNQNTIIIIGGPNAGKTHFGGQLYGRLQTKKSRYKITSPPEDLTIFKEVLDNLNEGKSAGHTHANEHKTLELKLENSNGIGSTFSFPDYGGEQIKAIVNDRRLNLVWKEQVDKGNFWMLFIRPDEILPVEDIVNRNLPDHEVLKKRNSEPGPIALSEAAFYIELLQILLFAKKTSLKNRIETPKLTIVLSCWDLLTPDEIKLMPSDILRRKLPALSEFVESNWDKGSLQVMGLSSTGRTLSDKVSDMDFVKKGPENFGYIITTDGQNEQDLTLAISSFIE